MSTGLDITEKLQEIESLRDHANNLENELMEFAVPILKEYIIKVLDGNPDSSRYSPNGGGMLNQHLYKIDKIGENIVFHYKFNHDGGEGNTFRVPCSYFSASQDEKARIWGQAEYKRTIAEASDKQIEIERIIEKAKEYGLTVSQP